MTVVVIDDLDTPVEVTERDLEFDLPLAMTGALSDSSMTVVAVHEVPDDPEPAATGVESTRDLGLCDFDPNDLELSLLVERREAVVDDGGDLDSRRTSLMTKTLKKSAATGTARKINISVVHDHTDQNLDMVLDDAMERRSHWPDAESYAQK